MSIRRCCDFTKIGQYILLLFCYSNVVASEFAYIANTSSHDVSVIDTSTKMVVATPGVGSHPFTIAMTPLPPSPSPLPVPIPSTASVLIEAVQKYVPLHPQKGVLLK